MRIKKNAHGTITSLMNVLVNELIRKKSRKKTPFLIWLVLKVIQKTPGYTSEWKFLLCNVTNNNLPWTTHYDAHCTTWQGRTGEHKGLSNIKFWFWISYFSHIYEYKNDLMPKCTFGPLCLKVRFGSHVYLDFYLCRIKECQVSFSLKSSWN